MDGIAPYRPASGLFAAISALMSLHIVLSFASIGSTWMQIELLDKAISGEAITEQEAETNDSRQVAWLLVYRIYSMQQHKYERLITGPNYPADVLPA